jgi:pimeloyl-ACP methyl ester carboxylesterase
MTSSGATPAATTHELAVPGATLVYDVHGDLSDCTTDSPPLLVFGSPMDATGFATLAGLMADRVVVTYDPRNAGRSRPDEPQAAVPAEQHAADLHDLVVALGGGPVDAFGTSGGAVNALLWVAAHPGDVRTLVAHEPPLTALLPDHAQVQAVTDDILAAYDAGGQGPAMARFIRMVMHRGPVTEDYLATPAPDPATFGLPAEDDGSRDDPLMANLRAEEADLSPHLDALRSSSARIVVAVGEDGGGPADGELSARATYAVAAALGQDAVVFPGGHGGFLGGEYGQQGKPLEFAARLREVLG